MQQIRLLTLLGILLVFQNCQNEDKLPLVLLDTVKKGSYPRLLEESDNRINLYDIESSIYTFEVEFIDEERGELVDEYIISVSFEDNDLSNGDDSSEAMDYIKFTKADFTEGENGYVKPPLITISATDILETLGLNIDQISAGDNFLFESRVVHNNGRVFTKDNSSATISGPAFKGHFNFKMPALCFSDLAGEYDYTLIKAFCGSISQRKSIEIIELAHAKYSLSDWSLGTYEYCYGAFPPASWGDLSFTDDCGVVSFTGFVDNYGETWEFDSRIDDEYWIISWNNTYGESGTSAIHFPSGVPFTLAE